MAGHDEDVRKAVDAAVDSAVGRLKIDLASAIAAGLPEPPAAVVAPEATEGSDFPTLREKLFALFDGSGQVETLNVLMEEVGHYWAHAVLFLVKGTQFVPWDARGFEDRGGRDVIKTKVLPSDADTILSASLRGAGAQAQNGLLVEALGSHEGECAAVPLGIRNKPAAVRAVRHMQDAVLVTT